MEVQRQEEIFLRKEGNTVINSNNTYGSISNTDWYVNVFLTKSLFIDGYVQINQDNFIYEIERQNINPYFFTQFPSSRFTISILLAPDMI